MNQVVVILGLLSLLLLGLVLRICPLPGGYI
jgi:hypothetical protein